MMTPQNTALPWIVLTVTALFGFVHPAFYHSYTGKQISEARYRQYQTANLVPFCAIEIKECDPNERRRLDYSCNNLHSPQRGATLTPYRRMLPPIFDPSYNHRPSSSGAPLPWARNVRVGIMSDGRQASKKYTHMVPNSLLYITGEITTVHDTANYVAVTTTCCAPGGEADPRCMPVYVPNDDIHLRRSDIRCMNLTRVITYQDLECVSRELPPERVNTHPPMLDMSFLYGNDENHARKVREGRGGRLRTDMVNGREWPRDGGINCVQNQRIQGETRCHDSAVPGTNVLIGPIVLTIWFYRLHNTIARELEAMNPCWDDERLYFETREITIALINQIWYYELMVNVLGYEYLLKNHVIYDTWGHINDYDYKREPQVSIEYVIGTRWFHSMQEGRIKMYDQNGKYLDQLNTVELTFRTGMMPNNRTLEGVTQSFFRQPCAEADYLIDPDMGERVLGTLQRASDVMSSDIMKGRDSGLPPYNYYRNYCNLPVAKDFDDLEEWMPKEKVEALRQNYETVDDIDIMPGIISEWQMEHAATGPTLACIMADQLLHWRRADRFWYENNVHPNSLTKEQLYQVRHITMARIMCDYADEVDEVQPNAFLVPGEGNKITSCKNIPSISLEPWRDHSCKSSVTPSSETKRG